MKRSVSQLIVSGGLFVIGVCLFVTLFGWIDPSSMYATFLPLVIIIAGLMLLFPQRFTSDKLQYAPLGILFIGITSLLVRFDVISGDIVNGILGVGALMTSVVIFMRTAPSQLEEKQ